MRTPKTALFLLVAAFASAAMMPATSSAGDLAVIVNKKTPILGFSTRDLRGILLGGKDSWPSGQKVIYVTMPIEAPETRLVLKEICSMSEGDFKRYFMQLSFQGKTANLPHIVRSFDSVKAAVSATPGALGIVPAQDVDDSVSVVSLDGVTPGKPNYKLSMIQ